MEKEEIKDSEVQEKVKDSQIDEEETSSTAEDTTKENCCNEKECKKNKKEEKKCNKEIKKLQDEVTSLNDKLLRVTAEMQNMKRRYEEEISRMYKYDGEDFIKKTLTIVDNFERAINMDDNNLEDEVSKFLSGFKLIYSELLKNLDSAGVKTIDCLDKPFDPEKMEAVLTEHYEDKEPGIVVDVMQKGYTYNDKVIRHAMVKVSE